MQLIRVSKSYGTIRAVREQSLIIEDGTSLCILGRNGSGKSTLLKIIGLLINPDSGSVVLDGKELSKQPSSFRDSKRIELIGYSFQEPLLIPYLTAIENVLLADRTSTAVSSKIERASRLLSDLGLSERMGHLPSKLSGGERKRIDLARAINRDPKILVADEPLSNLDADAAQLVVRRLQYFARSGGTVICSAVEQAHSDWANAIFNLSD